MPALPSLLHMGLVLTLLAVFMEVGNSKARSPSVADSHKYEQLPEIAAKGWLSMEEYNLAAGRVGTQVREGGNLQEVSVQHCFYSSCDLPPKAILKILLVFTTAGVLLVLLNIPAMHENHPPQERLIQSRLSLGPRLRNSSLDPCSLHGLLSHSCENEPVSPTSLF